MHHHRLEVAISTHRLENRPHGIGKSTGMGHLEIQMAVGYLFFPTFKLDMT
jgi:hypothetical protein